MRYSHLLGNQLRVSLLLLLQYRAEFFVSLFLTCFWTLTALVPLFVVFGERSSIGGWSWAEALLVVGWFNVLKGVQAVVIQPSINQAVQQIRKGTLDFVLIKPADAQLLISTQRFDFRQLTDVVVGAVILGYGMAHVEARPGFVAVLATLCVLACSLLILYALWIMVMSCAFVLVKVDNLTYLFSSFYDASRWPGSVFRGALSFVFTFVLPLALMTTYPAMGLLGRLGWREIAFALAGAALFTLLSRRVWKACIRRYTGAGG